MGLEDDGKIKLVIEQKLTEIEIQEQVKILHAVESGSRAWGFEKGACTLPQRQRHSVRVEQLPGNL